MYSPRLEKIFEIHHAFMDVCMYICMHVTMLDILIKTHIFFLNSQKISVKFLKKILLN